VFAVIFEDVEVDAWHVSDTIPYTLLGVPVQVALP
jgi:hypothetical protein